MPFDLFAKITKAKDAYMKSGDALGGKAFDYFHGDGQDPTTSGFYKTADSIDAGVRNFANDLKNNAQVKQSTFDSKKEIARDFLKKKGYNDAVIEDTLSKIERTPNFGERLSTNLGNRAQEFINTSDRVASGNSNIATQAISGVGDAFGTIGDVAGAVVSPYIEKGFKAVTTQGMRDSLGEGVSVIGKGYEGFKKNNPNLADTIEGGVNIGSFATLPKVGKVGVKGWIATGETIAKVGEKTIDMGKNVIRSAGNVPKKLMKSGDKKLLSKVGANTEKGVIDGKVVNVPTPQKSLIEKATFGIGRESDKKVLAGRAMTPSYAGKTAKQRVQLVTDTEKNIRDFYNHIRTGKLSGEIGTLEDGASTVVRNLDDVGAKIGEAIKGVDGKASFSVGLMEDIQKTLASSIESQAGAYPVLKRFHDIAKNGLTYQDAFKAKKIFGADLKKLIMSGDVGTDSYSMLSRGLKEMTDSIDNAVETKLGPAFRDQKSQYTMLKKIVDDLTKSAVVEGRRSPQTFMEQLGTLEAIVDGFKNPLSLAKRTFAKEIGEMNTRGGAWKELIKLYDTEAIQGLKKGTILKPKKPKPMKKTLQKVK